jgi:hypothetical protein
MMPTKVAVAWLRKEDWPRWRLIDPELPPHAEWHIKNRRRHEDAGEPPAVL